MKITHNETDLKGVGRILVLGHQHSSEQVVGSLLRERDNVIPSQHI